MKKDIILNLTSLNFNYLKIYTRFLHLVFKKLNLKYFFFFKKKKKKKITLLKSPHVNKKAQEHFEFCSKKIVIKIRSNLTLIKRLITNKPKFINAFLCFTEKKVDFITLC